MEKKRFSKGKGPKNHFSRKRNTTAKMRNVKKMIIADCDDNSEEFLEEIMEAILPENFEELEREPLEGDFVLVQYIIDGKDKFSTLEKWRAPEMMITTTNSIFLGEAILWGISS
jgi:hypothetical protein